MKKLLFKQILLLSAALFLASCAMQKDVESLRYQLRIVNKKMDDMKADTIGQMQKRQALAYSQIDQLEKDIMQLRSQLEESYSLNQRLREQNKELQQNMTTIASQEASQREEALRRLEEQQKEKAKELERLLNVRLQEQEANVKAIQQARIKEAERRAQEAALDAELAQQKSASIRGGARQHLKATRKKKKFTPAVKQNAPEAPPVKKQDSGEPPQNPGQVSQPQKAVQAAEPQAPAASTKHQELFNRGNQFFKEKEYHKALTIFDNLASGKSPLQYEAQYMKGLCLLELKQYDQAILPLQSFLAHSPNTEKVPKAILYQAQAFEEQNETGIAINLYKKIIRNYAGTPEAKTAEERLNKL